MHFFYTSLTIITTTLEFALSWNYELNPTFGLDNCKIEISFYQQENKGYTDHTSGGLYCCIVDL